MDATNDQDTETDTAAGIVCSLVTPDNLFDVVVLAYEVAITYMQAADAVLTATDFMLEKHCNLSIVPPGPTRQRGNTSCSIPLDIAFTDLNVIIPMSFYMCAVLSVYAMTWTGIYIYWRSVYFLAVILLYYIGGCLVLVMLFPHVICCWFLSLLDGDVASESPEVLSRYRGQWQRFVRPFEWSELKESLLHPYTKTAQKLISLKRMYTAFLSDSTRQQSQCDVFPTRRFRIFLTKDSVRQYLINGVMKLLNLVFQVSGIARNIVYLGFLAKHSAFPWPVALAAFSFLDTFLSIFFVMKLAKEFQETTGVRVESRTTESAVQSGVEEGRGLQQTLVFEYRSPISLSELLRSLFIVLCSFFLLYTFFIYGGIVLSLILVLWIYYPECEWTPKSSRVGLAISQDGGTIVTSAVSDKAVSILNAGDGRQLKVLNGHTDTINSIAITADGATIVSGAEDETLRMWCVRSGSLLRILLGHTGPVYCVAIAADAKFVVSGSYDRTVRIWTLDDVLSCQILRGHNGPVNSVAISEMKSVIVSGSVDRTVRLWCVKSHKQLQVLNGHSGSVCSVGITQDGATIVSGSSDATVRIWNEGNSQSCKAFAGNEGSGENVAVTTTEDDVILVAWSYNNGVCVYNKGNGEMSTFETRWKPACIALTEYGKLFGSYGRYEFTLRRTTDGLALSTFVMCPSMRHNLRIFGERNLAVSELRATDSLAEAEPLMRSALRAGTTVYGQHSVVVAIRLENLSSLLREQVR